MGSMQGMILAFRFSYLGVVAGSFCGETLRGMLLATLQMRRSGRQPVDQAVHSAVYKGAIPSTLLTVFLSRGLAQLAVRLERIARMS